MLSRLEYFKIINHYANKRTLSFLSLQRSMIRTQRKRWYAPLSPCKVYLPLQKRWDGTGDRRLWRGGKPPRARLREHDGLNLTWNNRTFCGVLCARSVLTPQNECQATMCALSTGTTLTSFEPSVYCRKLTRTGERRVRGRSGNDTIP